MDDLKLTIAKNITELRRKNNLTQAELALRLNYSDKAISKWERGESLPDITVLKCVADNFNVTVDYFLHPEHHEEEARLRKKSIADKRKKRNLKLITCISILLAWLLATIAFVVVKTLVPNSFWSWFTFICALPVSSIIWLIFNSIWFNKRLNFTIISLLMWSSITVLYLAILGSGLNIWLLFALGIPGQAIIFLWSGIRISRKKVKKEEN